MSTVYYNNSYTVRQHVLLNIALTAYWSQRSRVVGKRLETFLLTFHLGYGYKTKIAVLANDSVTIQYSCMTTLSYANSKNVVLVTHFVGC